MGARGRACPICSAPGLSQQVNALLESGAGPSAIAKVTLISKDKIARHKKHAFQPSMPPDQPGSELEMSDQRLSRWMERSEEAYLASAASSDLRGLVESLRSGLRAEMEYRRRAEKRAEQTSTNENLPPDQRPVSISQLDAVIRAVELEDEAKGMVVCPRCFGRGRISNSESCFVRRPMEALEPTNHDTIKESS